jgi:hypothetical protein
MVCFSTLACSLVVLLSFIWQQAANTALLLVSPFALAGAPLVSLGFMGCNQELSEVSHWKVISSGFIHTHSPAAGTNSGHAQQLPTHGELHHDQHQE